MKAIQDALYVEDDIPVRDETARGFQALMLTGQTRAANTGGLIVVSYRSYLLTYTSSGRREKQECFNANGRTVEQWLYDSEGRPLEQTVMNESGTLNYRFKYVYESGLWKEREMIEAEGRMSYHIVADREADGRLERTTFHDADGALIRTDIYHYNRLGQLARVDMGSSGSCEWEYDAQGNLAMRSRNLPGASILGDVDEFEYDERELMSRKINSNGEEMLFIWTFKA